MMAETPPGMPRLLRLGEVRPAPLATDDDPAMFVARIVDLLDEAASDGAVLVEVRCGQESPLRPDFMALFREAERRVQARYPRSRGGDRAAAAVVRAGADRSLLSACLRLAREGLTGIDFLYRPYDTEADWSAARRIAEPCVWGRAGGRRMRASFRRRISRRRRGCRG